MKLIDFLLDAPDISKGVSLSELGNKFIKFPGCTTWYRKGAVDLVYNNLNGVEFFIPMVRYWDGFTIEKQYGRITTTDEYNKIIKNVIGLHKGVIGNQYFLIKDNHSMATYKDWLVFPLLS